MFEEQKHDDNENKIVNVTSELLTLRKRLDKMEKGNGGGDQKGGKKEQLRIWLKDTVGLEQYFYDLVCNGFDDLESLSMLTMNELNTLGNIEKMGHRMKLLRHIAKLRQNDQEGQTALV